jgi:hypothetical protein
MAFTDYTVFFVYKKEYPKISKDNRYLVNAMRKFQFSGEFLGFPLDVKEQENLGKDFVTSVTFYDGNWRTIISALENVLIKSGHKQGNTRILAVYNTKDDLHILVQYNNVFKDTIIGVQNGDLCVSSEEDIEHENVYKILRKQKHINYVRKDIIKEMRSFRNQVKLRK